MSKLVWTVIAGGALMASGFGLWYWHEFKAPLEPFPFVAGTREEAVVIPARYFLRDDGNSFFLGVSYWSPTEADVVKAETGLQAYLAGLIADSGAGPSLHGTSMLDGVLKVLKEGGSRRQYVGLVEPGWGRVLFINGVAPMFPSETTWRGHLISANDGWPCFWRVVFDPATGRYSDFSMNGSG